MASSIDRLVMLLRDRFGVSPEFSRSMRPVLERLAATRPDAKQWEEALGAVAEAYRVREPVRGEALAEVHTLLSEFLSETQKLDESLKVLSAYLERIRTQVERPSPERLIH
jgi:hypothetical protein